jgi:hypothetical protein
MQYNKSVHQFERRPPTTLPDTIIDDYVAMSTTLKQGNLTGFEDHRHAWYSAADIVNIPLSEFCVLFYVMLLYCRSTDDCPSYQSSKFHFNIQPASVLFRNLRVNGTSTSAVVPGRQH